MSEYLENNPSERVWFDPTFTQKAADALGDVGFLLDVFAFVPSDNTLQPLISDIQELLDDAGHLFDLEVGHVHHVPHGSVYFLWDQKTFEDHEDAKQAVEQLLNLPLTQWKKEWVTDSSIR